MNLYNENPVESINGVFIILCIGYADMMYVAFATHYVCHCRGTLCILRFAQNVNCGRTQYIGKAYCRAATPPNKNI